MATWLYRIGEAAARRAWAVILIWVLIIAGVASAYTTFHGKTQQHFHHARNANPAALR